MSANTKYTNIENLEMLLFNVKLFFQVSLENRKTFFIHNTQNKTQS